VQVILRVSARSCTHPSHLKHTAGEHWEEGARPPVERGELLPPLGKNILAPFRPPRHLLTLIPVEIDGNVVQLERSNQRPEREEEMALLNEEDSLEEEAVQEGEHRRSDKEGCHPGFFLEGERPEMAARHRMHLMAKVREVKANVRADGVADEEVEEYMVPPTLVEVGKPVLHAEEKG